MRYRERPWYSPLFWRYPTPVNLSILFLMVSLLIYGGAWLIYWVKFLPWPPA